MVPATGYNSFRGYMYHGGLNEPVPDATPVRPECRACVLTSRTTRPSTTAEPAAHRLQVDDHIQDYLQRMRM